ncbi:MAG: choline dehydrogenase [Pseudomonadales bacterium]
MADREGRERVVAEADFVVVGAGSAGSVLGNRLSEASGLSTVLVEHGGSDAGPFIQMPAALSYPMNMRRYDWGYRTEPEPGLGNRRLAAPRGKVLGGSSSINGMVYVRGHPQDFQRWQALGAEGWDYSSVLPYFKRLESAPHGDPSWRGVDGPLHVTRGSLRHPLDQAFLSAAVEAGFGLTDDYNGARQEGFGALEQTIWQGRRWSAANAYLRPALARPNLRLVRGFATRVLLHGGRAVGVELLRGRRRVVIRARREVVLAASAFNSPKLLMLSGIGPADELRGHGIRVSASLPGVGANLQDHLETYVQMTCRRPVSLNAHMNLLAKARIGAQWLLTRRGIGASNHFESGGFARSADNAGYPDVQLHFLPAAVRYDGSRPAVAHGFQAHVGPMRSKSRGRVRLRSADPTAAPVIAFNYMSHPHDWRDFRRCIRMVRNIFAQPAFADWRGAELAPGSQAQSDQELDAFVAAQAESAYHPCGTCRMGDPADGRTVVDPHCRVIGVDGLRVVDSSVFPHITNGNINAPTLMLAERAADLIRAVPRL